ncbi:MAG TPA: hypothetical protein ENJ19_01435 [Gammaproteobacteria bacterium]|nr:hypothetical protein [Gammaproteobacteria bacterium]
MRLNNNTLGLALAALVSSLPAMAIGAPDDQNDGRSWHYSFDHTYSHGMPSSRIPPQPSWFSGRFGLARGVGEAIRLHRLTQWDNGERSYAYYIGDVLYAWYDPWGLELSIRDLQDTTRPVCHWDPLSRFQRDSSAPREHCETLLHKLAATLARSGPAPL